MKPAYFCAFVLCWSLASAGAQSSNPHRDPTDFQPPVLRGEGIIGKDNDTHKLEQPDRENLPERRLRVDPVQLKREADELSTLAQSISREVGDTQNGALPKDLSENLKKIQKLSKHLRDELKL